MMRWGLTDEALAELGQRVVADSGGAAFEFRPRRSLPLYAR